MVNFPICHSWHFPTSGFTTQWGKIHTTFLLSGGMRHTYPMSRGWNGKIFIQLTYARHALLLSQSDHALVSPVRPHWSNLRPGCPVQYKTRETPACTVYHTAISRDLYAQPAAQNWSTHAQTGSLSFSYLPGEVERRRSTKQHTVRFV